MGNGSLFLINNMKAVGFTNEYDVGIIKPEFFDYLGEDRIKINIDKPEELLIYKYVRESEKVFSMTLALFDKDVYIGPYIILTDGEWIWPSHYEYNLRKNNFSNINSDFLQHMRRVGFNTTTLSIDQKKKAKTFLESKMLNSSGR